MSDAPEVRQSSRLERTLWLAATILTAITGAFTAVNGLSKAVKENAALFQQVPNWLLLLLAATLFLLCFWAFRKSRRRSVLLRIEALRLKRENRAHLIGRDDDIDVLSQLCRQHSLVFLIGESGTGKSALLQAGLVPNLTNDENLLPVYTQSIVGEDWERDPRWFLESALRSAVTQDDRDIFDPTTKWGDLGPDGGLATILKKIRRRPLVILDQFDDYQIRHRDRFLHQKTWLTSDKLCNLNTFWRDLEALVKAGSIHLLVATRSDTAGGLFSVSFGDPETYNLDRLPGRFVGPLLERLEHSEGGKVIADPEYGWTMLRERLEGDLEEDGAVLPQQLKVVLAGLGSFHGRELTTATYERAGGVRGIEARFIEDQIAKVVRLFSLSADNLRMALLSMVDTESNEKTIEQPQSKLVEMIGGSPQAAIEALNELERGELVRKHEDPARRETTWSLDHDYLARAVTEADRRANRWKYHLADGAKALKLASGSMSRSWRALLPVTTQIAFFRDRILGRFRYANHKRYAAISMVKFLPSAFVLAALLSGGYFEWERRAFERIRLTSESILNRFDRNSELTDREVAALLSLRSAEAEVRKYVTEKYLTDGDRAEIFLTYPEQMTRALTRVSPALRAWMRAELLRRRERAGPEPPTLSATHALVAKYLEFPEIFAVDVWLRAIGGTTDQDILKALGTGLVAVAEKLNDVQAAAAIDRFLKVIAGTNDSDALQTLGTGLSAVAAKLSDVQAAAAIDRFLKAVAGTNNRFALRALGTGLGAVAAKLNNKQAAAAIDRFLKAIAGTNNSLALRAFGTGLGKVAAKLNDKQAAAAIDRFIEAIAGTKDSDALQTLGIGLDALPAKLSDKQAAAVIDRFIEAIAGSNNPSALQALGTGLSAVAAKLSDVQAAAAIDRFLKAVAGTNNRFALRALGTGLGAVAAKLNNKQAAAAIDRFIEAIAGTKDSDALQTLGIGLDALPAKLSDKQAAAVIDRFIEAIAGSNNPSALQALGTGLGALPAKLKDAQAIAAINRFLKAITGATDQDTLKALGNGLGAVAAKLNDKQAAAVIDRFIEAIAGSNNPFALQALGTGLGALPAKLSDAQAIAAINRFLKANIGTTDQDTLKALGNGLGAVAAKLSDAQAAVAIDQFLKAIVGAKNPSALQAPGTGLGALPAKLSNAQASVAIDRFIEAIDRANNPFALQALGTGLGALPAKLSDAQAAVAIDRFLKAIAGSNDPFALQALGTGLGALPAKLSDAQAAVAIDRFLTVTAATNSPFALQALGAGLGALPAKLSDAQAAVAIDRFIEAIDRANYTFALRAFGTRLDFGLGAVVAKLNDTQAAAAIDRFLKAIAGTNNPFALQALGTGLGALPAKLNDEQAAAAIDRFVTVTAANNNPFALRAIGTGFYGGLKAVVAKLNDTQAAAAIDRFLKAINSADDRFVLRVLGTELGSVAAKLNDVQAAAAIERFLEAIASTNDRFALQALGIGLDALAVTGVRPSEHEILVPQVMSALSNPLATGDLARGLLALLEKLSAEKFHGNVWNAVAWIKAKQSGGRLVGLDLDRIDSIHRPNLPSTP